MSCEDTKKLYQQKEEEEEEDHLNRVIIMSKNHQIYSGKKERKMIWFSQVTTKGIKIMRIRIHEEQEEKKESQDLQEVKELFFL